MAYLERWIALLLAGASAAASAATTLVSSNFDDDPLGAPSAPWQVYGTGLSSVSIIDVGGHHRHVMLLDGDTTPGSFATASTGFDTAKRRVTARFDVRPARGASFVWSLTGPGSYSRVRLQLDPGTTALYAQTDPSGNTTCGPLQNGKWTEVTFAVDTRREPHRFDVLLDGQPTACTGVETDLGPPFEDLGVMDASNEGWGGRVQFDNFVVEAR